MSLDLDELWFLLRMVSLTAFVCWSWYGLGYDAGRAAARQQGGAPIGGPQ